MPDWITETDRKEAKDWFKSKIEVMKNCHNTVTTLRNMEPEQPSKHPTFKAYLSALSEIYRQFADVYEVMDGMMDSVYSLARQADSQNVKLNNELKKLKKKFGEHEPTLRKMKEAFDNTEKVFDNGR